MALARLELLGRNAAALFVEDLLTTIRETRSNYEKDRNPFWTGRQFPAGVRGAGEPENWRQRDRRGVRQNGQSHPGRAVRIRRGHRSHFAGRAVLSGVAEERGAHRHGGREQYVLVERRL